MSRFAGNIRGVGRSGIPLIALVVGVQALAAPAPAVLAITTPMPAPAWAVLERRLTDILDGTSNTMILAECAGRNLRFFMGGQVTGDWSAGPWANPNSRIQVGGCDPTNVDAPSGPKMVNCINDKEIYSFHSAGANICLADGSVRFLKDSSSMDLVLSLLTRARGEVISGDY